MAARREYRVELYVDAIDEKAVWSLLKQLKSVKGAGLIEEPIIATVFNEEEDDEETLKAIVSQIKEDQGD